MTDTRHTVLRALRDLCEAGHKDITPLVVSRHCGEADDYAWQEMCRCRVDGLAGHNGAPMASWSITDSGRQWVAMQERVVAHG